MSDISDDFERRIERIHRLIETEGSVVVWNDKRPDPDNPSQLRQIDVSITRDSKLAIVECRIHKNNPQDVKWIEELIGRRLSLRADVVIAVSASGFTKGARSKARQFGIILRDFHTLTAEEIRNWGRLQRVRVILYEITELRLTIGLPASPTPPIRLCYPDGVGIDIVGVIRDQVLKLESQGALVDSSKVGELRMKVACVVNDVRAESAVLEYKVRRISLEVSLTAVVAYADPLSDSETTHAYVAKVPIGDAEIIEAADDVAVVADMTKVALPPRSIVASYGYDFGRPVRLKRSEILGTGITLDLSQSLNLTIVTERHGAISVTGGDLKYRRKE